MAVHRKARRFSELGADAERQQVSELVERYGNQWLATARRSCSTSADAEDAFQRAVETLLTSPPAERDPERIAAWMHTVVRNEALQIVRSTRREVDAEFEVIIGGLAADTAIPEEAVVDAEDHGVAREALQRLRPDQTRCLLLRADGFDYPEICRITGFSYAKVNRLLSEGRKAARVRVDSITEGRECERIEPLLSMFVDGVANAEVAADVRMHLEHCSHCRATARDYTLAPKGVAALLPVGVLATGDSRGLVGELVERAHGAFSSAYDRIFGHVATSPGAEAITAKKIAAATAIVAAIAGGGAAVKHAADQGSDGSAGRGSVAVTGPQKMVDPIPAGASLLDDRRRASAASRRVRSAREQDLFAGKAGRPVAEQRNVTPTADDEVAADENNAVPDGAPADTGTNVGGLGP